MPQAHFLAARIDKLVARNAVLEAREALVLRVLAVEACTVRSTRGAERARVRTRPSVREQRPQAALELDLIAAPGSACRVANDLATAVCDVRQLFCLAFAV